jgi:sarcosine oxidase subunit alpha
MNRVMQRVARRIAGIGTLPDRVVDTAPPRAVSADVLVVGGGIAGLSAAIAAARAGADVLLAEEGAELGGWFSLLYRCSRSPGPPLARLIAAAEAAGVRVLLGHSVVSITDGIAFAAGPECGVVVRPKRLIVATGSHEGAVAIPGNDLPAVLTCRGALELLARGILPGQRVLVVGDLADLGPLRPLLAFAGVTVLGPYRAHQVVALKGRPWIKAAEVREHGDEETSVRVACDAVVLAARPSGAYELAAQAGAAVVFRDGGFFVDADELGRTANPWVRAAGQCAGGGYARFKTLVHAAQRVGREIARELGAEAAS